MTDNELTAPEEGRASTPSAIADELCDALVAFDHVDYNALTVDELRDLLGARDVIEELCLRHRERSSTHTGGRERRESGN